MYSQISVHNIGIKQKIRVLVVTGNEKIGVETAYKYTDKFGKTSYNGYLYNVFQIIKDKLQNKYDFDIKYTDPSDQNYTGWVKDIADGKYDLVIGGFTDTHDREKIVNFTVPLYMNSIAILHKRHNDNIKIIIQLIIDLVKPIFLLIFLGILFGIILHYSEPNRGKFLDTIKGEKSKNKLIFIRTILTTISAFFGEMGFLSENTNLSIRGIVVVILIMIIAYVIILSAQARITTLNVKLQKNMGKLNFKDIKKHKYLGFKGNVDINKIENEGGKVTKIDNMTFEKAIEFYLKNSNKYSGGFVTVHTSAYPLIRKYKDLIISYEGFGLMPACWAISKNKPELLDELNKNILLLREREILGPLCKKYLKYKNACLI